MAIILFDTQHREAQELRRISRIKRPCLNGVRLKNETDQGKVDES